MLLRKFTRNLIRIYTFFFVKKNDVMKFLDTIEYIRSECETEKEFREFWNVLHYIFSILENNTIFLFTIISRRIL